MENSTHSQCGENQQLTMFALTHAGDVTSVDRVRAEDIIRQVRNKTMPLLVETANMGVRCGSMHVGSVHLILNFTSLASLGNGNDS